MSIAEALSKGDNPSTPTSLVQPLEAKNQEKISKPPPFYLSLIIRNKLFRNCMIDSGASSSVMPKGVVDRLGIKYRPIKKGVAQIDGTIVQSVGVIKNWNLALHACPGCSVLQDISVIELPAHFAICLSMECIAKIGGYLSFDWSNMLFRTRYGT